MFDSQNKQLLSVDTSGAQAQPLSAPVTSWNQGEATGFDPSSGDPAQWQAGATPAFGSATPDWKTTMKNNYAASLADGDPLDGVAEAKLVQMRANNSATESGGAGAGNAPGATPSSDTPEQPTQPAAANGNGNGNPQTGGQQTQPPEAPKSTMRPDLGESVKQYESGTDGPSSIARDNSYGSYQITASTMPEFLSSPEAQKYVPAFTGLKPGTPAFNAKWKEIAAKDPEGLHQVEKAFIYRTRYLPKSEIAKQYGFDISNPAIQDAIWSGCIQHNKFDVILGNAASISKTFKDLSPEDQLKALYSARRSYIDKIKGFPHKAVRLRYINELAAILELNKSYQMKTRP